MAASADTTRRWVATLIVALVLAQAGSWLWREYKRAQSPVPTAGAAALQRKIAASHAYDNALLRANALLDQQDTATARHLLDSLWQQPTTGLFQVELQKLQATRQRLASVRAGAKRP